MSEFGGVQLVIENGTPGTHRLVLISLSTGRRVVLDPLELEMLADCDRGLLRSLWRSHLT